MIRKRDNVINRFILYIKLQSFLCDCFTVQVKRHQLSETIAMACSLNKIIRHLKNNNTNFNCVENLCKHFKVRALQICVTSMLKDFKQEPVVTLRYCDINVCHVRRFSLSDKCLANNTSQKQNIKMCFKVYREIFKTLVWKMFCFRFFQFECISLGQITPKHDSTVAFTIRIGFANLTKAQYNIGKLCRISYMPNLSVAMLPSSK